VIKERKEAVADSELRLVEVNEVGCGRWETWTEISWSFIRQLGKDAGVRLIEKEL
jgi:hypothetical protein